MSYKFSSNSTFDKFYTNPSVISDKIIEHLELGKNNLYLEPSAGSGNLLGVLANENIEAYDIEPESNLITKLDFLKDFDSIFSGYITFMNPPYGKNSNLAVKFFNKAANFSKKIICIVPKTFKKDSIIVKLNSRFHLVYSEDLPLDSFIVDNKPYSVPTCIQVWVRESFIRQDRLRKIKSSLFDFGTYDNHNFAVRRAGSKAGKIITPSGNVDGIFWIIGSNEIKEAIENIDFSDIVSNTAGVKSLSKSELIYRVEEYYEERN